MRYKSKKLYAEIGLTDVLTDAGLYRDAWRKLKKNKGAVISMILLALLILLAIFGEVIAPYDPAAQDLDNMLQNPSSQYWLGTDQLGRDVLSRVIVGARVSLSIGLICEAIAVTLGVVLGTCAGYFGGMVDTVISRLIEILSSFPTVLFAMAVIFVLGPGVINVFIALGVIGWTSVARIIRGQIMQLKQSEYILAAKATGASELSVVCRHLIPNCLSTIIVIVTLDIPACIMTETFLSFIGLGVQPPAPSWGSMIDTSRKYLRQTPFYALAPGIALMLTVLAFNTLGDALRDALDPRLKNL